MSAKTLRLSQTWGWFLALIVPAVLIYTTSHSSMNWACSNFTVIFSAALVMWIFRLVPEYAPAIFVILATVLLGLAPQQVLLSGFGSDSFFLALSVFGIGAVTVKSRIFYRLSLLLITHLPRKQFLIRGALFLMGVFFTPVITAQSARVSLIAPLIEDIRKTTGLKRYSVAANSLACSAFHGAILLSILFMTGKSSNFVLYGMLPEQTQWQFGWLNWTIAGSVAALVLIICFFFLQTILFRNNDEMIINRMSIHRELKLLGPLSATEWSAIASVLILLLGLIFSSWHHIPTAWVSFSIFFVLLTSGVLDKQDFKTNINWPFLFYLGAIIGIMRCVQEIGINDWIMNYLSWLADVGVDHFYIFITLVYALSWIGGLLFGTMAAPALMFTLLFPVANQAIINPWLIAFIIIMATEAWVFPYQASYYLFFEEWAEETRAYNLRSTLMLNTWLSLFRLAAIWVSVPFWQWLDIL
jgi:DASS family divalent anion:Na+ symporter